MGGIYTTRLILTGAGGVAYTYTVPPARRVILTNVLAAHAEASGASIYLQVNATNVWIHTFPVGLNGTAFETRLALYAGDTLTLYCTGVSSRATATGYVFEDVSPLRAAPPVTEEPIEMPPLPPPSRP